MSEADKMFEELGYEDSPVGYGAKRFWKLIDED